VFEVARFLSELGDTDCEVLDDAFLVQPVNALTSLSYVIVGVVIALGAIRSGISRTEGVVYGLCLAAVGLGSVAFHGPQPAGSGVLHDLPILVTAFFILVMDLRLLVARPLPWWWIFAGTTLLSIVVTLVDRLVASALTGVVLLAVAALEFLIHRRHLRAGDLRSQRWLYGILVGVLMIAGATWILGRSDAPLCRPHSLFQFHGLWHALSAVAFGAWWWLARRGPAQPTRG
jgi:hypothetical protein